MKRHHRSLIRVLENEFGRHAYVEGAEICVWKGELSADVLRYFPNLRLVMIDLWEAYNKSAMHDKDNNAEAMQVAYDEARGATRFASFRRTIFKGFSVASARSFDLEKLDWFFLDCDHFYDSVKADLHAWWPKLKPGGIAAGHDYNGAGDRRKGWGVKRAVDEFFSDLGLEVHVDPGRVWWVKKPLEETL